MKVAVVGSYGVGLAVRTGRMPLPGETLLGGPVDEGHGGKGSNQAVGAARLGAEVSFLTAIGDDGQGRGARELWRAEGVECEAVLVTAEAATMLGVILVEPSGENRIIIAPGALDLLDEAAVEGFRSRIAAADVLVVSMEIPLRAVLAALRIGREEGVVTLLNPAPAQPLPDEAWSLIDVITPNQTEAAILLGFDPAAAAADDEGLARALAARGGARVVMTRGAAGALVIEGDAVLRVPAVPAPRVVDTTGAGDAFTAALAVALAGGAPIAEAVAVAARAGSHAVTIAGVIPALPTRADLA